MAFFSGGKVATVSGARPAPRGSGSTSGGGTYKEPDPRKYGGGPTARRDGEKRKREPLPWAGSGERQTRGERAPLYTPDPSDPRNAGYFMPERQYVTYETGLTPDMGWGRFTPDAVIDLPVGPGGLSPSQAEQYVQDYAARTRSIMEDPYFIGLGKEYEEAKARGDKAAMTRIQAQAHEYWSWKNSVARGKFTGTFEQWRNRHSRDWPAPKSTTGEYWYRPPGAKGPDDPGLPGPPPPNVVQGAGGGGADSVAAPSSIAPSSIAPSSIAPRGGIGALMRAMMALGPGGGAGARAGAPMATPLAGGGGPSMHLLQLLQQLAALQALPAGPR